MRKNMGQSFTLEEKVIVVTGATGVIGKSFIEGIAEAGGTVGILGRNRKVAEDRATHINRMGGKAIALCADVNNRNDLGNAKRLMIDTYGKIDGLVNAAGGSLPEAIVGIDKDIFSLPVEGLKKVMDLNLWGSILPTQVFGDAIARNGEGSIVNISSISAKCILSKDLGFSLAKAAIACFTQWFAVELGRRYGDMIRINAIAPGFFSGEQSRQQFTGLDAVPKDCPDVMAGLTPFKRLGHPNELKGALIWLLGDSSRFVTGTTITIDGGFMANSGK
jgi:NAD(P)-dependent dehydrogenase (short-subunit alcohol dehydrogenase family)